MNYIRLFTISMILNSALLISGADIQITKCVCEYHQNPVGIDIERPRFSWQIISDEENMIQTAYEIRVAEQLPNLLQNKKLLWNSGRVSSGRSVNVQYEGPLLKSMQRVYWQVRIWNNKNKTSSWSDPAFWETGILDKGLWEASWITVKNEKDGKGSWPAQYYRNEFSLTKKIKSARIYMTSLGLYELFLNGKRVGDQYFTPGWTSYNKRLQYQTYDVTSMLGNENALGAILADGWYRGKIGYVMPHSYYGNQLALLLQMKVDYYDGTSEIIISDKNWKFSNGPIQQSGIYDGELYDAQLEMTGWDKPGYNDRNWEVVTTLDHSKDMLVAPQGIPVKAIQEIKPVRMLTTPKGETVLDMGQNMVGWLRINVKGRKGDVLRIRFAEVLDSAGNFYTENLRSAKATNTYILKGEGEETYEPHFTFFGFRFVKLEGLNTYDINQFTGVVIHSAMTPTGTFICSDSLINQLQSNICWGQKDNFLEVPTDCPQRDERLGWTGDAQVFSMTAAFNFDVAAFYTKWLRDLSSDQLSNGKVTDVVPDVLKGDGGSAAWSDVAIVIPWTVYCVYGDTRILEEQYPSMKGWVEYMRSRAGDDNLWNGDNHYGDHLAFASKRNDYTGATTEEDLIATAYYCYSSAVLSKAAAILGKKDDTEEYARLSGKIKKAFIQEFVTPNGRIVSHTQTAYAIALSFDLLPENLVSKTADYFAADVIKFGHLTTGFVGTPLLCKTLSQIGRDDLAFMLLKRKKYPSWLYPVTQGATTIWERWDGQRPDGSFQDPIMNSFNHYAYGAIGEWLYSHVAGIRVDPENPGYRHFFLNPHPGGGLSYVRADFSSIYGMINSSWKINGNNFTYDVIIPPNTTATVFLPHPENSDILMNNKPVVSNGYGIELGSGSYRFTYSINLKTLPYSGL
jgi:alpha-L-rhamnosidase